MRTSVALALSLLVAGGLVACGSSKKAVTTPPPIQRLPQATSAQEWATRIVQSFLIPLNKDLTVLNALNVPDVRIYIASANPTTLRVLRKRMNHLRDCDNALIAIGPPPASAPQQRRVSAFLTSACSRYERVADAVLKAIPLLSSGRADVAQRGTKLLQDSKTDSRAAALALGKSVCVAQRQPAFRRAGLRPLPNC
jgi:hypothetical protein